MINNKELFLFSVGNSFDALFMHISEFLRVSILNKSKFRYIFAFIFLAPFLIFWFPFFIFNKNYFFIFTLFNFGNFFAIYSKVKNLNLTLKNSHSIIQIDGDLIFLKTKELNIKELGVIILL